jgi:undecaprenyl-diphosphatase
MEEILQAIVLGVVQGLTEFLPISSSGHLIIVRDLFGWEMTDELTFDVGLHVGTTIAVALFFRREWIAMARSAVLWATRQEESPAQVYNVRLLGLLALGSVPVAVFGLLAGDWIEEKVRSPEVVGVTSIDFALILWTADRWGGGGRGTADATPRDSLAIGGAQAIALIPGVSRSGVTISAGLARRFGRQEAARFSFLLSTPAIAGAALLTLTEAAADGTLQDNLDIVVVGAVVSCVVGWLAIAYLLRWVQTRSYLPFVIYRVAVGLFVIAYFAP